MAVERMLRVRLYVHGHEVGALAAALQDLGCFQPEASSEDSPAVIDAQGRDRAVRAAAFLASGESRGLLSQFFRPRRPVSREEIAAASSPSTAKLVELALDIERQAALLRQRRDALAATRAQAIPWRALRMSHDELAGLETVAHRAVRVSPSSRRLLEKRLRDTDLPVVSLPFERFDGRETLLLLSPRTPDDATDPLLDGLDAEPVDIAFLSQRPEALIASIDRETAEIDRRLAESEGDRRALARERPAVELRHDLEQARVIREEVVAGGSRTEATAALDGWIPEPDAPRLSELLERRFPTGVLQLLPPGEEAPPVRLRNPEAIRPFEVVTELFGRPHPGELDPTPLLAPFFLVFFGLCLTDAAYGVILALLSYLLLRWGRARGVDDRLFRLMLYGGISTVVLGAITGGWFGDIQNRLPDFLAPVGRAANALIVFSPLDQPMTFMVLSLALGFVQIETALAVKVIGLVRSGNRGEALLGVVPWLLLIPALMAWAAPAFTPAAAPLVPAARIVAGATALTIVLYGGPGIRNPLARVGLGLYTLYGVSAYLGDLLSYLRLVALGLSTGVIGMVINLLAGMLAGFGVIGWIPALILLVAGHALNLAINLLGAYIHTSRLQYVEFFPKFFQGGGKAFVPLAFNGRFTFKPTATEGGL